jgi:hypothetical protein
MEPRIPAPVARNRELEGLATGIELTLASVLQGIPLALLVPRVVDLIVLGDIARLLYAPASVLIVFMVWISFILYALSFVTWPFDPIHNLLYFAIVTVEAILLALIDRPGIWFGALLVLGVALALNARYNRQQIERQRPLFAGPAGAALHQHIVAEQAGGMQFAIIYVVVGLIGAVTVPILETIGFPQQFTWGLAALGALVVPLVHVVTVSQIVPERSRLIEAHLAELG